MNAAVGILRALYRANGQFVAAGEVQEFLEGCNVALDAEITALKELGYTIELHPHHGYRLLESPDRLMADDLEARLDAVETSRSWLETAPATRRIVGSEVLVFEETASTNDVCEKLARSGGRDGLVVFAESQTRGRGRHGRVWASPRGKGLWFSVLLQPQSPTPVAQRITVAASVAVARVVREASGLDARIKWPNDVTVNGKKIAGILTESRPASLAANNVPRKRNERSSEKGQMADELAILGVGVNVNCAATDFPPEVVDIATSLSLATGQPQNRPALAATVLLALDKWYRAALTEFDTVSDEWARLSMTLGQQIVVRLGARRIEGCAQALDSDGALLVRKDNGQVERMLSGDLVQAGH
jgi:BirA family biotin operon repressor/biotin-[acetyl-CoA-carboxylase] ligase